jgi:hypothetical protein
MDRKDTIPGLANQLSFHQWPLSQIDSRLTVCAPKPIPGVVRRGSTATKTTLIRMNFGAAECVRTVSFGSGHPAAFKMKNATTMTITVPSGGRKGLAMLTVTTASAKSQKRFW